MTYQAREIINFEGTEYRMPQYPWEDFPLLPEEGERRSIVTSNYRGYVGHWKIQDAKLYLLKLDEKAGRGNLGKHKKEIFFPGEEPVWADWYSGKLHLHEDPVLPEYILAEDFETYGFDWVLTLERGVVIKIEKGTKLLETAFSSWQSNAELASSKKLNLRGWFQKLKSWLKA